MTDDPSESNPTCSGYSTLEESIWDILYFDFFQKTKGMLLVWPLVGFFLSSNWVYLNLYSPSLLFIFCIEKSVVCTLSHLRLTFSILEILYKNVPPNIRMIDEAKKR